VNLVNPVNPLNPVNPDPAEPGYAPLDALGITYDTYTHPPVFNSEDVAAHWAGIAGTKVKNLFLRNKKGDRHYLVILEVSKQADLRQLVKMVGDDRLSFGSPERLMARLGLTPGSVSPFGLIHDTTRAVRVVIDADLRGASRLIFHPNINTASVTVSGADLERFLASRGNVVTWVKVA
jgi:Ala-tRNA(Pro) deacylase